jgi:hypothetical protein
MMLNLGRVSISFARILFLSFDSLRLWWSSSLLILLYFEFWFSVFFCKRHTHISYVNDLLLLNLWSISSFFMLEATPSLIFDFIVWETKTIVIKRALISFCFQKKNADGDSLFSFFDLYHWLQVSDVHLRDYPWEIKRFLGIIFADLERDLPPNFSDFFSCCAKTYFVCEFSDVIACLCFLWRNHLPVTVTIKGVNWRWLGIIGWRFSSRRLLHVLFFKRKIFVSKEDFLYRRRGSFE